MHLPQSALRIATPLLATLLLFAGILPGTTEAQEDVGSVQTDGGGQEVLQSIFIPPIAHAPFSLTLSTEWIRPIKNGGNFTTSNSRPIKRDSSGRIYEERWLLSPKGSGIPSRMLWIQIADPNSQSRNFGHFCRGIGARVLREQPASM